MQRLTYDIIVVGGGILGTATARELLLRNPILKLSIVEKEKVLAAHQSGHNSGVLHTGIYYTPGSLKAKLCVEGIDLAYRYCDEKKIPYKKCGKTCNQAMLIVAVNEIESKTLDNLFKRGIENGVKGIRTLDRRGIKEIEPHIEGVKAIWSPHTGIVDWAEVNRSFGQDCVERGARLHHDCRVTGFRAASGPSGSSYPVVVQCQDVELECKFVVTCGGLQSDRLAVMTGCSPEPRVVPFRGEYLLLRPERCHLVKTNVYPVPHPDLPFLGVHITPRMDGSVWLGPNAVLAFKREGYRLSDVSLSDVKEFLTYSGFRKLARKHLGYGAREMYRGINIGAQIRVLQQYLPELKRAYVTRGPTAVRAQAVDRQGHLVDDFVFDSGQGALRGRVLHVRNAPSPAATSSLAIAKVVVDKMQEEMLMGSS